MASGLDRERRAIIGRRFHAHTKSPESNGRPRAISAAEAVRLLDNAGDLFSAPEAVETPPFRSKSKRFPPHCSNPVWRGAIDLFHFVCGTMNNFARRVWNAIPNPCPDDRLRATLVACTVILTIAATATFVGSEIDLTKLMPGNDTATGRPRVVVIDGRLLNQGDAPALNLEVTRPRYRLVGTLDRNEGITAPAPDFAVQYEWKEGNRVHRESRSFKIGNNDAAQARLGAGGRQADHFTQQRGYATTLSSLSVAGFESGTVPPGLAAAYNPATHLLTVSASRPTEVRVDGFLLRPISRTDKDGTDYRYSQANILVMGQDLKSGETTTFEVVFTKPQDFYSIPIYVREPGKPAVYLTVSLSTGGQL